MRLSLSYLELFLSQLDIRLLDAGWLKGTCHLKSTFTQLGGRIICCMLGRSYTLLLCPWDHTGMDGTSLS